MLCKFYAGFLVPFVREKVLKPSDGMCDQKGSFVDDEKLRFDFSWSGSLTAEQVQYVHVEKSVTGRAMLAFDVCEVPYSKRFLDEQVPGFFFFAITFICSVRRAPCHAGHLA